MSGYTYWSVFNFSWRQEQAGGPWCVRDPEGVLVARARNWWVAARWACSQRRDG